ncbi:hypothetical protein NQZ79_g3629 [Umbelopsis isabellina]|nr:hypothetical protein NQZ79_g3629 [Umbelopsis isabellina]
MQVDEEDDIDIGGSEGTLTVSSGNNADGHSSITEQAVSDNNTNSDANEPTIHVAPDYVESKWIEQANIDTSDMDDQSKALIEQMLAEEEYYFGAGSNSLDHDEYHAPKAKKRKVSKRESKVADNSSQRAGSHDAYGKATISSAELPSHKTRWSAEEDQQLKDALEKYGYGNWKAVSEAVGSRNPLQCKNHARHLVNSSKVVITPSSDNATESTKNEPISTSETLLYEQIPTYTQDEKSVPEPTQATVHQINGESVMSIKPVLDHFQTVEDEPTVDIDDDADSSIAIGADNETTTLKGTDIESMTIAQAGNGDIEQPTTASPVQSGDIKATIGDQSDHQHQASEVKLETESEFKSVDESDKQLKPLPIQDNVDEPITPLKESLSMKVEAKTNESVSALPLDNHKLITLISDIPRKVEENVEEENAEEENVEPIPNTDVSNTDHRFHPERANEDEIKHNREWFMGKASKTEERYLKIRNTILAAWRRCQPRYLTKTSARNGLKDCGDVNAIGRVHTYLESIGAINVNCTTNAPRPKRPAASRVEYFSDEDDTNIGQVADWLMDYEGPRKRKVRDEKGRWVDPKDLEGRVIEHGVQVEEVKSRPKRTIKRPKHLQDDDFRHGYDPFRLVPLEHYDEDPPFHVYISSDAMIVMDFHSYLAHTEIIGLLGGKFDAKEKRLEIQCTFPCKSTSTGIQCEMDPESEMKAREVFAEMGMTVVGWYHSHPTFEPNPSVRDIENQSSYQSLFRHDESGLEPFIGVIVSPYDYTPVTNISKIQYLSIGSGWDSSGSFRMPFACISETMQSNEPASEIYPQLQTLVQDYCDYEHRVNMFETYSKQASISRLEKLLESLSAHLIVESEPANVFLARVRQLITEKFPPPPSKSQNGQQNDDHVTQQPQITPTESNSTSSAAVAATSGEQLA